MEESKLNIESFYDYLVYCKEHNENNKLVIIITNNQTVYNVKDSNADYWEMIVDINKKIFPDRNYNDYKISNDTIIVTSIGNDLEVEIPKKVSENQYHSVKEILKQGKQFEEENNTSLYMPFRYHEIISICLDRAEIKNDDIDEVILNCKCKKKKH